MSSLLIEQLQTYITDVIRRIDSQRNFDCDVVLQQLDQFSRQVFYIIQDHTHLTDQVINIMNEIENLVGQYFLEESNSVARTSENWNGKRGRPKIIIPYEQVLFLLSHGFHCTDIAAMLNVPL